MSTDAELAAMLAAEQPPPAPSDANRRTVALAAATAPIYQDTDALAEWQAAAGRPGQLQGGGDDA